MSFGTEGDFYHRQPATGRLTRTAQDIACHSLAGGVAGARGSRPADALLARGFGRRGRGSDGA